MFSFHVIPSISHAAHANNERCFLIALPKSTPRTFHQNLSFPISNRLMFQVHDSTNRHKEVELHIVVFGGRTRKWHYSLPFD